MKEVPDVHKGEYFFPTDRSGKPIGNKPRKRKCKLDTGASVHVMALIVYKLVNPDEFDKGGKPVGGYGQDRTTLRGYSGNLIQLYRVQWVLEHVVWYCRSTRTHIAGT